MIWIEVANPVGIENPDYALNYKLLKEKIGFEERGSFCSWELVERFVKKGVVKGYVLYHCKVTTNYTPVKKAGRRIWGIR